MHDFLNGMIIGILVVLVALAIKVIADKLTVKPEAEPINLDPNDFPVPTLLPLFKKHRIKRMTSFNGNVITMTWKYKGVVSNRTITINDMATAQYDFNKAWLENEVSYYIRNKDMFKGKKK